MQRAFWVCPRCKYQEPVSQYKQSPTRFCPQCFRERREQVTMKKNVDNSTYC